MAPAGERLTGMSEATEPGAPSTIKPGMEKVFTRSTAGDGYTHSLCPGCGEPNAVRVLTANIEEMRERENTVSPRASLPARAPS